MNGVLALWLQPIHAVPADYAIIRVLLVVCAVGLVVASTSLSRTAWVRHRREQRQREMMRKWLAMCTQLSGSRVSPERRLLENARTDITTQLTRE